MDSLKGLGWPALGTHFIAAWAEAREQGCLGGLDAQTDVTMTLRVEGLEGFKGSLLHVTCTR